MELEKQIEQLEAQIASKDGEIDGLGKRVKELGAFRAEALNARDTIEKHDAKVNELETELARVKADAAAALSEAKTSASKKAASAKKVEAALKMAEAVRELLG